MARTWSRFQKPIFHFVEYGTGNGIVEAVAGSGKTTTCVEAVRLVKGSSIFLAFNKSIAEELKARGVNARTFHSLTYSPVLNHTGAVMVSQNKMFDICKAKMKGDDFFLYAKFCCHLVGLAKQSGVGCLVPDVQSSWIDICLHHNIEPENDGCELGRAIELSQELLGWSNASQQVNFDDMLYLAVKNGISLPKYDMVFVDEAQDTNAIQRALLHKIIAPGGRMIAVGDPHQSIYGFRGADSDSMKLIKDEFDCQTFPLSVSYRCAANVVTYARKWVDHIEAADDAPDGEVSSLGTNWEPDVFKPADLVVCRKSAPLLRLAYACLRARVPVQVMGREIGAGLKNLVHKMNADTLAQLNAKLSKYRDREYEKAIACNDEAKAEAIDDKVSAVQCLAEGLPEGATIKDLCLIIDGLFAESKDAVILATIHKSKGLEAERVFWLDREQCPAKWAKQDWQQQQEINLCYVAATRAKHSLFFISAK